MAASFHEGDWAEMRCKMIARNRVWYLQSITPAMIRATHSHGQLELCHLITDRIRRDTSPLLHPLVVAVITAPMFMLAALVVVFGSIAHETLEAGRYKR